SEAFRGDALPGPLPGRGLATFAVVRWRPSPRARRRLGWVLAISALLHLAALLALLPWVRKPIEPQALPPASVAMVFESGNPKGPSAPEPTPEAGLPTPPSPPPAPPPSPAPAEAIPPAP